MYVRLLRQLGLALVTLALLSALIFAGTQILPGDVAIAVLGQAATEEALQAMRQSLGLETPAALRYLHWLGGFVTGDLGTSLITRTEIAPTLWLRLCNTFVLAASAAVVVIPLSVGLGIACAIRPNSHFDRLCGVASLLVLSLPAFLIAYTLIIVFSVHMDLLPSMAPVSADTPLAERVRSMLLPVATLTFSVLPYVMRMVRSSVMDVLRKPYIEMATLKGVPRVRLVLLHALPNALAPIIQTVALNLAYLVAGVVLIEEIFVYPGIGKYLVDAVGKRDIPVIQATAMVFGATYVLLNRAADTLTILTNPRLRLPR